MFAVVAAVLFVIAQFEDAIGPVDLVLAGLFFVALHLAVGDAIAARWGRRTS